jgi:hypothetical protein
MYYYDRLAEPKAIGLSEKIAYFIRYLGGFLLLLSASGAIYLSLTRSYADLEYKENTIPSLQQAARRTPGNAAVHLALGIQLDLGGQDAEPEFRAAVRLNPFWAEPRMRLGLLAETRNDNSAAERLLLEAAEVDHQFAPRAALMRFYARQGRTAEFWRWARLALERAYGDLSPLFDLCWSMAAEPQEVYTKAVPPTHTVLKGYLTYLVDRGRTAFAAPIAHALLPEAGPADRDVLLEYCERLIDLSPADAIATWNASCRRGLLPYEPLDPQHHPRIVNADFSRDPVSRGFDWKLTAPPEVSTARLPDGGMELSFNGRQAEAVELISQVVPTVSGRKYRVSVDFQTENIAKPSGLTISADDPKGGPSLGSADLTPSEAAGAVALEFTGPPPGAVAVRFRYRRPLGSVRTEGTLIIRHVQLEETR